MLGGVVRPEVCQRMQFMLFRDLFGISAEMQYEIVWARAARECVCL